MGEKLSTFQMIMFSVLVIIIIAGVTVFAVQRGTGSGRNDAAPITMWGTLPENHVRLLQEHLNDQQKGAISITYTEFTPEEFEGKLIEALASDTGPDTVIFPDEMLLKHENKLFVVNYEAYPQLQYKNAFIDAGDILLRDEGIVGFPLSIDPFVLYWNRTILNNEGVSLPPEFWDDFLTLVPTLVVRDETSNISRAAVGMGEYRNVNNAKTILTSLIQQAGNDLVTRDAEEKKYESIIDERLGYALRPADTAVNFFVQFSNPIKDVYTWNRALPNSRDMFLAGDLAFYFGYASELPELRQKNPNLNFDVTFLPQSRSSEKKSVTGKMHFLGILNRSQNIADSFTSIAKLITPTNSLKWSEITGLPPVRNEVLVRVPESSFQDIFNRSALISVPFLDPNSTETEKVFQSLIESVIIGSANTGEAVNRADDEFDALLSN